MAYDPFVESLMTSSLNQFPSITLVTDDGVSRTAPDLTLIKMPPWLYWQGEQSTVVAIRTFKKGLTALDKKRTTNTQSFKLGDFRVWPNGTPVRERRDDSGWIVKKEAYDATYKAIGSDGLYTIAQKVGKVRALIIPSDFFVLTLDSDKPFWYEAGSVLVQQVTATGEDFLVDGKRDLYAMSPEKFKRYTEWSVG